MSTANVCFFLLEIKWFWKKPQSLAIRFWPRSTNGNVKTHKEIIRKSRKCTDFLTKHEAGVMNTLEIQFAIISGFWLFQWNRNWMGIMARREKNGFKTESTTRKSNNVNVDCCASDTTLSNNANNNCNYQFIVANLLIITFEGNYFFYYFANYCFFYFWIKLHLKIFFKRFVLKWEISSFRQLFRFFTWN